MELGIHFALIWAMEWPKSFPSPSNLSGSRCFSLRAAECDSDARTSEIIWAKMAEAEAGGVVVLTRVSMWASVGRPKVVSSTVAGDGPTVDRAKVWALTSCSRMIPKSVSSKATLRVSSLILFAALE